jgi:hypothetical protein
MKGLDYLMRNSTIVLLLFVLAFGILLVVRYKRDYHRLKTERSKERGESPVEKWYNKQTISTWMRWRRWTLTRYYHILKGFLLVRVISTYSYFFKGTIAIGVALLAYDFADRSAVVAGATVFYASMLFFESRFTYAALWPTDIDKHRRGIEGMMDSAYCNLEIANLGDSDARKVQTNIRIIDPVRDVETGLLDGDISVEDDETLSDPIESGLSREFKYFVTSDSRSRNSEFYRTKLNDYLGMTPWAVIDFRTPDALTTTRIYIPISESERISLSAITEGTERLVEAWSAKRERLGIEPGGSIKMANDEKQEDEAQDGNNGNGEDDEGA